MFQSLKDREREANRLRSLGKIEALHRGLNLPGVSTEELSAITRLRNAAMADHHRRFICP